MSLLLPNLTRLPKSEVTFALNIYKFLNVCPFDYTAVAGGGKVGP